MGKLQVQKKSESWPRSQSENQILNKEFPAAKSRALPHLKDMPLILCIAHQTLAKINQCYPLGAILLSPIDPCSCQRGPNDATNLGQKKNIFGEKIYRYTSKSVVPEIPSYEHCPRWNVLKSKKSRINIFSSLGRGRLARQTFVLQPLPNRYWKKTEKNR